jgi:hypothetical protein
MKTLLFVAMFSLSASASADIFKCVTPTGDIAFQSSPCNELSIEELINLPATSAGIEIISENEINEINQRALEKTKLEAQAQAKKEQQLVVITR